MRIRRGVTIVGLLLLLLPPAVSYSAGSGYSEYQVKAAFLYNFARFVDWPATASPRESEAFRIGILGKNPFGPALRVLAKEKIDGHSVEFFQFRNLEADETCHVLYISPSEQKNLPTVLATLAEKPILTVSDIPEFARQGGMIGLRTSNQRIRFEINIGRARDAGLDISSHLLGLAVAVYPEKSSSK